MMTVYSSGGPSHGHDQRCPAARQKKTTFAWVHYPGQTLRTVDERAEDDEDGEHTFFLNFLSLLQDIEVELFTFDRGSAVGSPKADTSSRSCSADQCVQVP